VQGTSYSTVLDLHQSKSICLIAVALRRTPGPEVVPPRVML